jgi:hypothetical protein
MASAFRELQTESQNVFLTIWNRLTINNLVKYLIQGIAVAIAAYVIPQRRTDYREVIIIALVAALTFFTVDIFTDDVAKGLRFGAGFGIGLMLVSQSPIIPQYLIGLFGAK